jgi:hypothetical protein
MDGKRSVHARKNNEVEVYGGDVLQGPIHSKIYCDPNMVLGMWQGTQSGLAVGVGIFRLILPQLMDLDSFKERVAVKVRTFKPHTSKVWFKLPELIAGIRPIH